MPSHIVHQGECLSSIAKRYGFADPMVIWTDAANKELHDRRDGDGNVLYPGDVVFIPARGATPPEKAEKKGFLSPALQTVAPPAPTRKLHLILRDARGQPLAGKAFALDVGGETLTGTTDAGGVLVRDVPADAVRAKLDVDRYRWDLDIAHLNPISSTPDEGYSGIVARLKNLGYAADPAFEPELHAAIRALRRFQADLGLPATGHADDETRKALEAAHKGEAAPAARKALPPAGDARAVRVVGTLPATPALCTSLVRKARKAGANAVSPGTPNVLRPARKGTCHLCAHHEDCLDNDHNFLLAAGELAERLGADVAALLGVMHLATGHTTSPRVRNAGSNAVGLLQLTPGAAAELGTSTEALASMCRIEQLEVAEAYFEAQKQACPAADFREVRDVALAVLEPSGLDPAHDVLGVSAAVCSGPFFDDPGAGRIEISDDMTACFKAHRKDAAGQRVVSPDGELLGVDEKATYYTARKDGEEIRVTRRQRAVYKRSSGLDRDGDGFLTRDDYRVPVEELISGCAKEACDRARALKASPQKEYQIALPGAPDAAKEPSSAG
ncbi:peptidoglycan-binding protein [Sorangium sp. So ce1099]|uniref:peptidoglycan-binding protein n=1 Tax=Sorangium sp. So ce1099 TaxID=3133331 RepID=UPI003F64499B